MIDISPCNAKGLRTSGELICIDAELLNPIGKRKITIRVQKNPKPVKVKARVECQRGWADASRGALLCAFSTSAPTHGENPKPETLNPKPETLNPKP